MPGLVEKSAKEKETLDTPLLIGLIDTGVNPWHSHVGGGVYGCRIFLAEDGSIGEDDDIRDHLGHGTAVAGILREQLPVAELFVVKVFEHDFNTYPSLVARAVLRAAAEGCSLLNLSLAMPPGAGSDVLAAACSEAIAAGCTIVAAGHPHRKDLLPASLPGVVGVVADDLVPVGEIQLRQGKPYAYAAAGRPRDLERSATDNLWGNSFACARVSAYLAGRA
jgi:subtilisin family serine protease